jgi:hypothetical protein
LYELYNQVPLTYSSTELTYLAISKLELAGIDESSGYGRLITLNPDISFSNDTTLGEIQNQFDIVEVQVQFDTVDTSLVSDLIDLLNESDQVFFVNYVEFYTSESQNFVSVTISSIGSALKLTLTVSPIPSYSKIPSPIELLMVPPNNVPASVIPRCKG